MTDEVGLQLHVCKDQCLTEQMRVSVRKLQVLSDIE